MECRQRSNHRRSQRDWRLNNQQCLEQHFHGVTTSTTKQEGSALETGVTMTMPTHGAHRLNLTPRYGVAGTLAPIRHHWTFWNVVNSPERELVRIQTLIWFNSGPINLGCPTIGNYWGDRIENTSTDNLEEADIINFTANAGRQWTSIPHPLPPIQGSMHATLTTPSRAAAEKRSKAVTSYTVMALCQIAGAPSSSSRTTLN